MVINIISDDFATLGDISTLRIFTINKPLQSNSAQTVLGIHNDDVPFAGPVLKDGRNGECQPWKRKGKECPSVRAGEDGRIGPAPAERGYRGAHVRLVRLFSRAAAETGGLINVSAAVSP